MKKSKRVLVLLVVLVMMTFALAPTVAFAAPAPLTVELSEGIILKAQTPDEDSRFYYTTSVYNQAAPGDDVNINTIAGATAYSADTIVGTPNYVQVYRVNTSGIITGFGEEIRHTLSTGNIYTGTIDVRDNGVSVGTFSYVYTLGLYANDYILADLQDALSNQYATLLNPSVDATLSFTGWYANYSTTGIVAVNEAAAAEMDNWSSIWAITYYILDADSQNESTDSGRIQSVPYNISARDSYDVVDGQPVKGVATGVTHVAYTIYESTAATVGLDSDARLIVDGEDYVRYGNIGEHAPVDGASYDMLTNTLTLNDYTGGQIKTEKMDLNIVLAGTSSISLENDHCIFIDGKLTINGSGLLTAAQTDWRKDWASAIFVNSDINIQSGTLILSTEETGEGRGIFSDNGTVTINASAANVTASGAYAIGGKAITITGDATLKEGDDAASAQTVESLTISDHFYYTDDKVSKRYVSITPIIMPPAPATYTITYASGGGTGTMAKGTATAGKAFTLPKCTFTAPTGKEFKAWKIGSKEYAVGASYTFSANTTVYAVWKEVVTPNTFVPISDINSVDTTLIAGARLNLTGAVVPSNATNKLITWSIKHAGSTQAELSANTLTAKKAGTVVVTATVKNGKTETTDFTKDFSIKVTVSVKSVKAQTNLYIVKGRSATVAAAVQPYNATNKKLTYKSSDTKVVSVNKTTGKIKAKKVGKATITVTSTDGKKTARCKVVVAAKATKIKSLAAFKTVGLLVGKTMQIKPKVTPAKATGIVYIYKSSKKTVASIDKAGVITAHKKGTTTITVKAGSKTQKFTVTVGTILPKKITLNKHSVSIKAKATTKLTVKWNPTNVNPKTVKWTTSNKRVATVSSKGVVKGIKKGKVTITATTWNGKTVKCTVTVR